LGKTTDPSRHSEHPAGWGLFTTASRAQIIAGLSGFLTLSQSHDGPLANALSETAPAGDDPVYEAIAKQITTSERFAAVLETESDTSISNEDYEDVLKIADDEYYNALWELLTVEPTNMEGVTALLEHLGQDEEESTVLGVLGDCWPDEVAALPLWLAETMTRLIDEQSA
jgi:hypothetical protein